MATKRPLSTTQRDKTAQNAVWEEKMKNKKRMERINLNAGPPLKKGYEVLEHREGGLFRWDRERVTLFVVEEQRLVCGMLGGHLRIKLIEEPTFNAALLAYLLRHPKRIPADWTGKTVSFWNTIYRCQRTGLFYVSALKQYEGKWQEQLRPLNWLWTSNDPAAIRIG